MDIGLHSDQIGLRNNVREVLAAECPPDFVRHAMADQHRWQSLWKTVVDLGWTAVADVSTGPAGDGTALGVIDLVVVLEACGAALAPVPLLSSAGLAAGVLRAGRGAFDDTVAELVDGTVATLAVQSPGQRMPAPPMTVTDGLVSGRADHVPDLARAELVVTLATDGSTGEVFAVVLRPGDGVRIDPVESVDPARPLANLEVHARPESLAPVDVTTALTVPLIAAAAELIGVADSALAHAVTFAKSRVQFGKAIGSFQGVKHALANNHVALERARSLTYAAAAQLDDPARTPADGWTAAALAKAAAGEAALSCVRTAVQVHGAIAQTWEHDMHLYLRRAWHGAALLGDSQTLYHAVGRRFICGETDD
ncbi:acyl-CoA dehydrogenase [Mycolicibacter heraklionensis]|uniref:Acyl-CoA dehydrogenase n=1 Tax=Mycolicibacter heraklionensis TaxID=512402 RepID=A0ABR5FF74_9MYCO|nr:acyl-CoA dehydrogenase family protein [Mycolicibacter heraklionensis]KLO28768.1 acyl-CoA dehydrogenase [Mycolicibacter heraklionensis]